MNDQRTLAAGELTGAIATAFPAATEAGAAMLRAGGNAVDAACAAAWALSVCEPAESGLGGQTTMLIRFSPGGDAPARMTVLDGHSRAPAGLTRARCGRRSQKRGHKACSIPSTVATLAEAHRRFGRLPLARVIEPAILLADEGYRITALQRRLLRWSSRYFEPGGAAARLFLKPGSRAYAVGEVFRQPELASTLRRIADAGPEDFCTGRLAAEIIEDMQRHGGLVSARDLARLRLPVEREPLVIEEGGRRAYSVPPPGGGTQVLLAMRILGVLNDREDLSKAAAWQLAITRATGAALRERERWPDHPDDMTPSLARWLVSRERAARIIEGWSGDGAGGPGLGGARDALGESGNTTHLCAADRAGNVVSLTQSIQSVFGAKVAHPTLGFLYNNYLSTCPRSPHPYRLGRRALPQSNAAPTIVTQPAASGEGERPLLALGSAGSRRITSSVVQVASAVLDRGLNLNSAMHMPRVHALVNESVWFEEGLPGDLAGELRARFKKVRELPAGSYKLGAVQAIAWDRAGRPEAGADPRRDGSAAIV